MKEFDKIKSRKEFFPPFQKKGSLLKRFDFCCGFKFCSCFYSDNSSILYL